LDPALALAQLSQEAYASLGPGSPSKGIWSDWEGFVIKQPTFDPDLEVAGPSHAPAGQQFFDPNVRPATQQFFNPNVRPAMQQFFDPNVHSATQQFFDPNVRPATQQFFDPNVQPAAQQFFDPKVRPATQQFFNSNVRPVTQQFFDPTLQPMPSNTPVAGPGPNTMSLLFNPAAQPSMLSYSPTAPQSNGMSLTAPGMSLTAPGLLNVVEPALPADGHLNLGGPTVPPDGRLDAIEPTLPARVNIVDVTHVIGSTQPDDGRLNAIDSFKPTHVIGPAPPVDGRLDDVEPTLPPRIDVVKPTGVIEPALPVDGRRVDVVPTLPADGNLDAVEPTLPAVVDVVKPTNVIEPPPPGDGRNHPSTDAEMAVLGPHNTSASAPDDETTKKSNVSDSAPGDTARGAPKRKRKPSISDENLQPLGRRVSVLPARLHQNAFTGPVAKQGPRKVPKSKTALKGKGRAK
jgi:hypothetical protein